jgi:hypothetical protein
MDHKFIFQERPYPCAHNRIEASHIIQTFLTAQNFAFTPSSDDQGHFPYEVIIPNFEEAGRLFLEHLEKDGAFSIRAMFVTRGVWHKINSNNEKALHLDNRLKVLLEQLALQVS